MRLWGILAALAALLGLAGSAKAEPGSGTDPKPISHGRQELDAQLGKLSNILDETQRDFLVLVARGESGFSSAAKNDSTGEAKAAGVAYDRHADLFGTCPYPRSAWSFGSGGWFGMLPANGAYHLRETFPCLDPIYVFDPAMSIVAAIAFARALQGWDAFQANPTVAALRAGWGNPGWMASPPPDKVVKWRGHATSSGLPADFLERTIKRFPSNSAAIYAALTGKTA